MIRQEYRQAINQLSVAEIALLVEMDRRWVLPPWATDRSRRMTAAYGRIYWDVQQDRLGRTIDPRKGAA